MASERAQAGPTVEWVPSDRPRELLRALPEGATDRPPLLFVHGLAHGAWCFAEHWLVAAAARGHPAYAISLRGHGGSAGRLRTATLGGYVDDVLAAIAEIPGDPVVLGHSMGGLVTQLLLQRRQPRAAVLLAPVPLGGLLTHFLARLPHDPANVVAATFGRSLRLGTDDLFVGLDSVTAQAYVARLGREAPVAQWQLLSPHRMREVTTPVLVVGTPEDRLVPVSTVEATAARFGGEPMWFPGIGHDLMLDLGQDRVLAAVLGWVDGAAG